jgi:hypothetical protein
MSIGTIEALVEPLTQQLVKMTEGGSDGVILSCGECYVQFAGGASDLLFEAVSNDFLPESRQLNDLQVMLLFGMGFDVGEDGEPANFSQEFGLEEGDNWEEQTLREFALQALALLYYVYECRDGAAYRIEPV